MVEGAPGESFETPLSDVSIFGCSIRRDATWIRPGRVLSLSLDGTAPIQAIVRWVSDGAAGMEFMREIPRERTEWHALLD